ncbi:hypothetical protein RYX36_011366 [Vicia faba]
MSQGSEQWEWSEMQGIELLSYSQSTTPTPTLELERVESKEHMEEESSLPNNKSCDFSDGNEKIKNVPSVGFGELFRFADGLDYILMTVGTLGAILHGCSLPVFLRFFADLVNSFGSNADDLDKMTQEVVKHAFYFLVIGAAIWASSRAEISCWMWTGERQSTRMRIKYLEAALDQDIQFFDTEVRTSDVVFAINTDAVMVQDVISEKLAVIGGIHTTTLAKLSGKSQEALSQAGNIVEQTVVQIRVVLAYVGETKAQLSCSHRTSSSIHCYRQVARYHQFTSYQFRQRCNFLVTAPASSGQPTGINIPTVAHHQHHHLAGTYSLHSRPTALVVDNTTPPPQLPALKAQVSQFNPTNSSSLFSVNISVPAPTPQSQSSSDLPTVQHAINNFSVHLRCQHKISTRGSRSFRHSRLHSSSSKSPEA